MLLRHTYPLGYILYKKNIENPGTKMIGNLFFFWKSLSGTMGKIPFSILFALSRIWVWRCNQINYRMRRRCAGDSLHWPDAGLMLGRHRRPWANIMPTLGGGCVYCDLETGCTNCRVADTKRCPNGGFITARRLRRRIGLSLTLKARIFFYKNLGDQWVYFNLISS